MQQHFLHRLNSNDFWLTVNRCIYWEQQQAIIVSDLHFGKTGHFRKHGIGVPQHVFKEDLQRLMDTVVHFRPKQIIAVGDLFHSHANKELDWFSKWREDITQVNFHLIKGNHDILQDEWYAVNGIALHEAMAIGSFCFVHDAASNTEQPPGNYIFSGHVHPGISLKIGSRQNMSFPCYYFGEQMAVLPAFSRFTGTMGIKPKSKDSVYAIVEQLILKV